MTSSQTTAADPTVRPLRRRLLALVATLALAVAACGADEGATVRDLGAEGDGTDASSSDASAADTASSSSSSSSSGSSSASAVASGSESASAVSDVETDGGYEYASDVSSHRLITLDVCEIKELLDADPIDFEAVSAVYTNGDNSVNADGSVRTLAGFAAESAIAGFVSDALSGDGGFDGEADGIRAQGVEKGIQNQLLVAWAIDELESAIAKAADGNFDVAGGAVHSWDEAWAFYHGAEPGCAPYGTADSRAENFATMSVDGSKAQANEAILAAMVEGRDALLAEDGAGAEAAAAEIKRNIWITYSQAAVRYASLIEDDLASGDEAGAREHQAEGLAFWKVIEDAAAAGGADVSAVNAVLDLGGEPGAGGFGEEIRAALAPFWESAGISADDIGTLQ